MLVIRIVHAHTHSQSFVRSLYAFVTLQVIPECISNVELELGV